MSFAGWYVVSFNNENSVEVIPSNWLVSFNQCLWPSKFGALKIGSSIKNGTKPSEDWQSCEIKVISKSVITDFQKATAIADKARFTSDYEELIRSQSPVLKRRKLIKKNTLTNCCLSDEESPQVINHKTIPDFPRPKLNRTLSYDNEVCTPVLSNKQPSTSIKKKVLPVVKYTSPNLLSGDAEQQINNCLPFKVSTAVNSKSPTLAASTITKKINCDLFENLSSEEQSSDEIRVLSNECQRSNDKDNLDTIILQCDNNYNDFQLCNNTINNNDDFEDLQLVNNYVENVDTTLNSSNSNSIQTSLNSKNRNYYIDERTIRESSEVSKQVLKQLVTLNARAKENAEYLHILMLNINDIQEKINKMSNSNLSSACNIITDNNKQIAELFSKFPVSNQDQLNEMTDEIKNVDIERLVHMFALIGGSDYKELTRRILKKLISDELAAVYSYTGHKGRGLKMAFNRTFLSTLLSKAVQEKFVETTNKQIECTASIWLTKASERLKNKST